MFLFLTSIPQILFLISVLCENVYRISSFYDPNIKLIQNARKELGTAFIHAHDDPRFYFDIKEASPSFLKIYSVDSNEALEYIMADQDLKFKEESNTKAQEFMLKLTPDGGYKFFQDGACLTLVENTIMKMNSCNNADNQVFMLLTADNSAIIKPYGEMTYTYEYTIQPSAHD